jgi:hypothetical protein
MTRSSKPTTPIEKFPIQLEPVTRKRDNKDIIKKLSQVTKLDKVQVSLNKLPEVPADVDMQKAEAQTIEDITIINLAEPEIVEDAPVENKVQFSPKVGLKRPAEDKLEKPVEIEVVGNISENIGNKRVKFNSFVE